MDLQAFLDYVNAGNEVQAGSAFGAMQSALAEEARKITMEINTVYHTQEELRVLFAKLTGKPVEPTFRMFPPFTTDCGKNITVGKNVFINSGCRFQDQGGIILGDGALIGHNVVMATLNHPLDPAKRQNTIPGRITLGKNVWIGSNATILPGVMIGDNAVVAAGAVVTKDVPRNAVVGGVPARVLKYIAEADVSNEVD